MTDEENRDTPARRVQAWMSLARPAEWPRWDVALLNADLDDDEARYRTVERQIITQWQAPRDDPLPEREARALETEQGIDWLGDRPGMSWRHAHALAIGSAERDLDTKQLRAAWRVHRDDTAPADVLAQVEALASERTGRLDAAKDWHRRHDPRYFQEWQTRNAYADTLPDGWRDERDLIVRHLAAPNEVAAQPSGVVSATPRATPRQRKPWGWHPWANGQHRNELPRGRSL